MIDHVMVVLSAQLVSTMANNGSILANNTGTALQ